MSLPGYVNATTPVSREASVFDHWLEGLTNLLLNNIPTTALVMANGGVEENSPMIEIPQLMGKSIKSIAGGGKSFRARLMIAKNSTVKSYDGKEAVPATEQDPLTYAYVGVKAIMGRETIYDFEDAMIQTPEAMVNWGNINRTQLMITYRDVIGDNLWDDGTGNSSKNFDGIRSFVHDTAEQTYAGIVATDLSTEQRAAKVWDNIRYTTAITAFGTSNEGLKAMNNLRISIRHYSGMDPDLIVTDIRGYEGYTNTAVGTINFNQPISATRQSSKQLADLGIEHLLHIGTPLVEDAKCPTGKMYMLNTKTIKLLCLRKAALAFKGPVSGYTIPADTTLLKLFANIICINRRANGVITTINGA